MTARRLGVVVAALVALSLVACSHGSGQARRPDAPTPTPTSTATATQRPAPCRGLKYADVAGRPPAYAGTTLRRFPAIEAACRAVWVPHLSDGFVPQSLALDGRTAWVAGYKWNADVAQRACRLMHIALPTGRLLADQARLVGAPGDRKPTFCRHGGGMALDRHGLWVAEKERLWLLDPAKVGRPGVGFAGSVLRVWALRSPVFGSTAVIHDGRIGLGFYRRAKRAGISWFRISDLLAPGVLDLVGTPADASQLRPRSRGRIAGHAQGLGYRPGHDGLWVSATGSGCGVLVAPDGRAIDVIPRIEGFGFTVDDRVWVLSEASARVFSKPGQPLVPTLTELDTHKLLAGPDGARCRRS